MMSLGCKPWRFGIIEFALITRLPCIDDLDKSKFKASDNNFKDKYFKGEAKVTKATFEKLFLAIDFQNDHDAMKFVILYLINNIMFFKDKLKLVKDIDTEICASGSYYHYPCERALWKRTLHYIQS